MSYEIQQYPLVSTIVFISDLHFDFVYGDYCEEQSEWNKNAFISHVKENYKQSILCIAGDCFSNWRRTLSFIKELEKEQIRGFIVLGNHDYWNDGNKGYMELLDTFNVETKEHEYFRLLTTGRKYYIGELCFIGDTGWTSLRMNGKRINGNKLENLPEKIYIKDFSIKQVTSMHDKWIAYANTVLEEEKQVIMLTHFPMICFAKEPKDCWWSSETKLKQKKNYWNIFGHTHKERYRKRNHVSAQRGYNNYSLEKLEREKLIAAMYTIGLLVKIIETSKVAAVDTQPLSYLYTPQLVENPDTQIELISDIKRRGYKRTSKNWEILAMLAAEPLEYIKTAKECMKDYEKSAYIGYRYAFYLSEKTIYAIHTSIASLEKIFEQNDFSNPTIFIMSAIITGYVYNGMAHEIDYMRPVDYYDVVRFYLVFQTMKKYNIGFDDIDSIKKHRKRSLTLENVPIGLPTINEQCMTEEEACLKGTPLLREDETNKHLQGKK